MSASKKEITQTKADIVTTQESIEKRSELVAERMKDAQIRGAGQNSIQALLDSESLTDFLNRAYAVTVLQNAEKSKIDSLFSDKEKLDELEAKLEETQSELTGQQTVAQTEKATLDNEVAALQDKLAANASALSALTSERIAKENAEREAAAKAAAEAQAAAELLAAEKEKPEAPVNDSSSSSNQSGSSSDSNSNSSSNNNTNNGGGTPIVPPVTPPTTPNPPATGGISGQATAYIATGNNTATGTVPTPGRTIAVDPSLIPLGSAVRIEVPSNPKYSGVYIAEDTGGVVHGAIIDIFVGSQTEAVNFGRRSIIITVL